MLEVIFLTGFLLITPSSIAKKIWESFERSRKNRGHTKHYAVCRVYYAGWGGMQISSQNAALYKVAWGPANTATFLVCCKLMVITGYYYRLLLFRNECDNDMKLMHHHSVLSELNCKQFLHNLVLPILVFNTLFWVIVWLIWGLKRTSLYVTT